MKTVFKIIILVVMINFTKTIKSIQDMCIKVEENKLTKQHFQKYYKKDSIEEILQDINATSVLGQGAYGKVYKVKYYEEGKRSPINIALKHVEIGNDLFRGLMQKEIAMMKEFADLSSESKYLQFVECYYFLNEDGELNKVYIATEILDDDLEENLDKFRALPTKLRYQNYCKIIDDLKYLHNDVKRYSSKYEWSYLDNDLNGKGKSYIHSDIKPANMMTKGKISSSKTKPFVLKLIDYGMVFEAGTKTSLKIGTPGFLHPSFYNGTKKNKVMILPQMDIYSLFISIAIFEYGIAADVFSSLDKKNFVDKCMKNYTEKCHDMVLRYIYKNYCVSKNKKIKTDDYLGVVENAQRSNDRCEDILCLILRNLNLDVNLISTASKVFDDMYYLWNKEEDKRILV